MAVEDGLAHIDSSDHKARLAQYSASVLASRINELTHAQRTFEPTQTEAKLLDDVPVSAPCGGALWTCTLCNQQMQHVSKGDHLAGKTHAKKLISEQSILLVPPHVKSTVSMTLVANKAKERKIAKSKSTANRVSQSWTCPSCNAIVTFQQKESHFCSNYNSKPSTIDGPLDSFFHLYQSFHYDASTPPAISFKLLQNHLQKRHRWAHDDPEREELWHRYQAALTQEFNLLFGVKDDLDAWHSLCRAVRITPLPTTCELCRSVGL